MSTNHKHETYFECKLRTENGNTENLRSKFK